MRSGRSPEQPFGTERRASLSGTVGHRPQPRGLVITKGDGNENQIIYPIYLRNENLITYKSADKSESVGAKYIYNSVYEN